MTEHTPEERAALRVAFNAWVRRTRTRFAPHMGAVDGAFAEWQKSYPDEVAAALKKDAEIADAMREVGNRIGH